MTEALPLLPSHRWTMISFVERITQPGEASLKAFGSLLAQSDLDAWPRSGSDTSEQTEDGAPTHPELSQIQSSHQPTRRPSQAGLDDLVRRLATPDRGSQDGAEPDEVGPTTGEGQARALRDDASPLREPHLQAGSGPQTAPPPLPLHHRAGVADLVRRLAAPDRALPAGAESARSEPDLQARSGPAIPHHLTEVTDLRLPAARERMDLNPQRTALMSAEAFEQTGPMGHARALASQLDALRNLPSDGQGRLASPHSAAMASSERMHAGTEVAFGHTGAFSDSLSLPPVAPTGTAIQFKPTTPEISSEQAARARTRAAGLATGKTARSSSASSASEGGSTGQADRLNALLMQARAQSSALQVAIRVSEAGLMVMARVERMSATERARLQSSIASLLAEHGLTASHLTLRGPTQAQSAQS